MKIDSVSFLSPRGKFDIEIRVDSLRLSNKTLDVGVPLSNIDEIFVLPVPVISEDVSIKSTFLD